MLTQYATYDEVVERYPSAQDYGRARIEALLSDASAIITSEFRAAGVEFSETDEVLVANARAVCCAMVMRAAPAYGDGAEQVKSAMTMAGPFSTNVTFANPTGDLYLTAAERKRLGTSMVGKGMYQVFLSSDLLGGD